MRTILLLLFKRMNNGAVLAVTSDLTVQRKKTNNSIGIDVGGGQKKNEEV